MDEVDVANEKWYLAEVVTQRCFEKVFGKYFSEIHVSEVFGKTRRKTLVLVFLSSRNIAIC